MWFFILRRNQALDIEVHVGQHVQNVLLAETSKDIQRVEGRFPISNGEPPQGTLSEFSL